MADLLDMVIPRFDRRAFLAEFERRKYLQASLMQQIDMQAEVLAEFAGTAKLRQKILDAMIESQIEKIPGIAARLVFLIFGDDLEAALGYLERIGCLPGIWPRECAQMSVHLLAIRHGPEAIIDQTTAWLSDERDTARRMAIEALRPRGVWVPHIEKLRKDPRALQPILHSLLDDDSLYVRKAVANNLNDISKDHPRLVCRWLRKWLKENSTKHRHWIAERALRTLIKQDNAEAQRILGLGNSKFFGVRWLGRLPARIKIGQSLDFRLEVKNLVKRKATCRLELRLTEPGKGDRQRSSRYLLGKCTLAPGEKVIIEKSIPFIHKRSKPRNPGAYRAQITSSGAIVAEAGFLVG